MANINRAAGLIPVRHNAGGTPQRTNAYSIAGGYATDIFRGDLVKSTGTGTQVAKSAAGDLSVGVFAGCEYVDTSGAVVYKPFWPASTSVQAGNEVKAWVYDDPNTVFEVQASADVVEADIRGVADIVAGTGNKATGTSGVELDSATIAATGPAQLKILGLVNRAGNTYGDSAKVEVLINEHELRAAVTAV